MSADVLVVGGGAVGCATAYFLSREGVRVRLLESDGLAGQASGAAAGMLAPLAEADHAGGEGGPLFQWGCRSLALYPDLCRLLLDLSGIDAEYEASGLLRLARSEEEARRIRGLAGHHPELGLEWLDARALRTLEPALAPDWQGGLWSPREAHVRSPLLTRAYAAAARQLGAEVVEGERVEGLVIEGDRVVGARTSGGHQDAGQVVVCTGARLGALGEWLGGGFTPPVEPVRGQIVALESPPQPLRSILWDADVYLVPKRDASVVVGATEERVGFDCRVTASGVASLLAGAPRVVPALGRATFRGGWAGLRPGSPDGVPAIGAVPGFRGLWVAGGHHRNGVLLSAVTGQLLRDGLLGKSPDPDARLFDPARWA
ncbi:MAG: glycine oxidase ThiO [Myxococcota bacterium]